MGSSFEGNILLEGEVTVVTLPMVLTAITSISIIVLVAIIPSVAPCMPQSHLNPPTPSAALSP